jgi:hypothetical protein
MSMMRKECAGHYQIGIWSVRREGARWITQATGPGTIGDGSPSYHSTLADAYEALTGERMPGDRRDHRPISERRKSWRWARGLR